MWPGVSGFVRKYSLVTSIDYSQKIGARSGIVGKDAPVYEFSENGALIACTVTLHKRQPDGYLGTILRRSILPSTVERHHYGE